MNADYCFNRRFDKIVQQLALRHGLTFEAVREQALKLALNDEGKPWRTNEGIYMQVGWEVNLNLALEGAK